MSAIDFNCPKCGILLESDNSLSGGVAECPQCGASVMVPMPGIAPGLEIAGFIVERRLGSGGMGEVWLANQKAMGRKVALKILSPALTTNDSFVSRFMAEVKTTAKLMHPNIITAFDAGFDKGMHYLAISFVEGFELDDLIKDGHSLPEQQALPIGRQVAEALLYAWDEFKLLHRDIKPSNIMLDNKHKAKLMDMGISKSLSEDSTLTMTGLVVGTPYYMSPEQARADIEIDCRSDVYALGATLYHAVTGTVPYESTSTMGILAKHLTDPFPSPIERNPAVSEPCAVLLEIMMAKLAVDRQQTWDAVIKDIDLVLAGKFPTTKRPEVGKSQIVTTSSQMLKRKKILKKLPRAKLGASDAPPSVHAPEPHKTPPASHINTPTATATLAAPPLPGISAKLKALLVFLLCCVLISAFFAYDAYDKSVKAAAERVKLDQIAKAEAALKAKELLARQAEEKAQAEKAERENTIKELYEVAADFAEKALQSKTDLDLAALNFMKIRDKIKDTKYELLADAETAKINALLRKLADDKAKAEKEDMERVAAEKEKAEAEKRQKENAQKLTEQQQKQKAEEATRKSALETEQKKNDLLDGVAADLLAGNPRGALDRIDASPDKDIVSETRSAIAETLNAESAILASFKDDIGSEIAVDLAGGIKENLKVVSVANHQINCEKIEVSEGKKIRISRKLSLKELSNDERNKRIAKMEKTPQAILLAIDNAKSRKFDEAKLHAADAGQLADVFTVNIEAKRDFDKILRLAELKPGIDTSSAKISDRKKAKELLTLIAAFTVKHAELKLAKDKETEAVLTVLYELAGKMDKPSLPGN